MFRNLFRSDSPLMVTMTQITDCIFLSLFWLVGCLPVVTMGASFAALYDATYRFFRKGHKHSWQRFAEVYRRNWKAGIVPTVVFLAAAAVLTRCVVNSWNLAVYGSISWMVFSGLGFVAMVAVGILSVLFPMLSRFENTTADLLKNTVLIALANLPRTVALGFLNGVCTLLCIRYVIPAFFLPALAALIGSLLIEPMFKPYLSESNEDAA